VPTGQDGRVDDDVSTGAWAAAHRASLQDPDAFWGEAARAVDWIVKPSRVLDDDRPPFYRWYTGASLNTCYNALDRHVIKGRADQPALVYDSPVTGSARTWTYAELLDEVARFGGVLRALGVHAGDRVVIYMPMVPQAVVAMLACARIGAVHSVVFGGFAPTELAARLDDAQPVVVVTASCGIEPTRVVEYKPLLDAAIEKASHAPQHVVVLQRPQAVAAMVEPRDLDWDVLMRPGTIEPAACVAVAATDPLYVLYTSGTTGRPKGIVRDHGGHAVALAWSMPNVFGLQPGETMFTASDVGWVVGHSYIVYGPLINGSTTVLYEGKPIGTPDAGAFWRVVAEHQVSVMFTAPTAIRAIKKTDPDGGLAREHDLSSLRTLFLAGERLDPDTWQWATDVLGVPVVDNWWQTETGWPIAANPVGLQRLPIKPGSPSVPVPGYDVRVLDPSGAEVPAGTEGAVCLRLPMPPGTLPTLWGDDDRYVAGYLSAFDGYYLTGDGGYLDDDGYLFVMGRTDDVINVAGHRLSTGSIEAALAGHPAVAECAVIGVQDALKGQVPRALVVLKGGQDDGEELRAELLQRVRSEVGAIASLQRVDVVAALPKTRSGKILRKTMRELADGKDAVVPSTIEDATVLDDLGPVLRG
jgi:propionyl-CoA synthetase